MDKKIIFLILISALTFPLFAEDETFTITTYYPSPYGSYNELQTNKMAIGDTNNDGQLNDADQPNRAGDIAFKPQSDDPASWPAGKAGELAYSSLKKTFYYFDGSEWKVAGAKAYFLACTCPSGSTQVATATYGTTLEGGTATHWTTTTTWYTTEQSPPPDGAESYVASYIQVPHVSCASEESGVGGVSCCSGSCGSNLACCVRICQY